MHDTHETHETHNAHDTNDTHGTHGELFAAVFGGADDTLVRLLRADPAGCVAALDGEGRTALYAAAVGDRPSAVRLLLAAGADPGRACGEGGADLPLCGAASGGHTEVVRALLAAGAEPDLREAYGFTAVAWAAVQGFAETLEALLEGGAGPDLPGPGGERPLVLAARRGSAAAVRALLRHGAGAADPGGREAALAEARHWLGRDVERELREGLAAAYGDGFETVVRRTVADGAETVAVELLRDGTPVAGRAAGTGHAAVATVLEAALGVRAGYEELARRALRCRDPERDDWREAVAALVALPVEETFQVAAVWCRSDDEWRRTLGADVLAELPAGAGGRSRALEAVRAVAAALTAPGPPGLVGAVVRALARHGGRPGDVARYAGHPDPEVRRLVANAPPLAAEQALGTLIALTKDLDPVVRRTAVAALAATDAAEQRVREALARRLRDGDDGVAAEAAAGLARRGDDRAVAALARLLARAAPEGAAWARAREAVALIPRGPERSALERVPGRRR
ncbi:ankyrin repeat domain-containing protein [Streptomyces sp. DW26H14]|uniref:ankyrin repeat domain-containing protein n=1 Tax=Streptomyces sp. DW26H14 TaxID=3435395 RepID=UPI00403D8349